MDSKEYLEQVLHHEIPLTKEIGVKVDSYDGHTLTLLAPLDPNRNHKLTAFGGSLFSIAVLTGWGLLQLKLHELNLACQIVIQSGDIDYYLPVKTDFAARCSTPEQEWQKLLVMLKRRGLGRIDLSVDVYAENSLSVAFKGRYVIHANREQSE